MISTSAWSAKAYGGIRRRDAVLAELELDPLPGAIRQELRDVQRAVVQILVAGGHAAVGVARIPGLVGDELVDVLVARSRHPCTRPAARRP